ncbi:MAG: polyprenol monophosphomannose synthase [Elusimicrobia bacterium]|nr:polyprenol monophosphomannose synthase [Elusimicrobiota bacterium]
MPAPETVGVVIPAYKEQDNIAALIRRLREVLPEAWIVVVDDSPDLATVQAAEGAKAGLALAERVKALHREGKGGRGSAVLAGMKWLKESGCGRVVEMDADFSHPPDEIPAHLAAAREAGLDLLIGSRYLPGSKIEDWPIRRRLFSRFANAMARLCLGIPITDYTNGFRFYSARALEEVVERCGQLGSGFIALSEILVKVDLAGLKLGERPTRFINRTRGESSVGVKEITQSMAGLWRIFRYQRAALRGRP